MHPFLFSLGQTFYPMKEKPRLSRDRPMRVLCLGISRSGTNSLRSALLELGHSDVHHGYRFLDTPGEIPRWLRLMRLKNSGRSQEITTDELDKCLGDCEAVTDSIATAFAHELLTAYPNAKVVLNYREDVDAWHSSVKSTIGVLDTSWLVALIWYFQKEMFWQRQAFLEMWRDLYGGNFDRDGKRWYENHYASLEKRLRKERMRNWNQPFLKWKVEDGWEPLCKYLDLPVPDTPFPSGNTAKDYRAKLDAGNERRLAEAKRNIALTLATVVVAGSAAVYAMLRK